MRNYLAVILVSCVFVSAQAQHYEGESPPTHYCAAGNQPRLKATSTEGDNKVVKFHIVDITNMPTPEAGHVRDLELRLTSASQITILFTFVGSGKESVERIELARKT